MTKTRKYIFFIRNNSKEQVTFYIPKRKLWNPNTPLHWLDYDNNFKLLSTAISIDCSESTQFESWSKLAKIENFIRDNSKEQVTCYIPKRELWKSKTPLHCDDNLKLLSTAFRLIVLNQQFYHLSKTMVKPTCYIPKR